MTRSLANWEADGGTIERPGGGRRFEPVFGMPIKPESNGAPSGPSSLADFCSRASIIDRCCSRTDILRWSCSLITGSCVWKPGDKQARPTDCILTPSRAVMGPPGVRAVRPPEEGKLVERSNLRGRGRLCMRGDEVGSCFTVILGLRLLCDLARTHQKKVSALGRRTRGPVPIHDLLTGRTSFCSRVSPLRPGHPR